MPLIQMFDKQINVRMGQANVKRWIDNLLPPATRGGDRQRRGFLEQGRQAQRQRAKLEPQPQEQRLGSGGNRAQKQAAGRKGGKKSS